MHRHLACVVLVLLVAGAAAEAPAPRDKPFWAARHAAKLREIRANPPQLIFVGDSITESLENPDPKFGDTNGVWRRFYGCRQAVNLGFAGDTTGNALWRLEHGEIDGIQPRLAIVLIGTNDIGSGVASPQDVAAGVRLVVATLHRRLPATRILVLSLLPRERFDAERRQIDDQLAMAQWSDWAADYIDVAPVLAIQGAPNPALYRDRVIGRPLLHPNANGWQRIAEAIEPRVAAVLHRGVCS